MTAVLTYQPTLLPVTCSPVGIDPFAVELFAGGQIALSVLPRFEDPLVVYGRLIKDMAVVFSPLAPMVRVLKLLQAIVAFIQAVASLNPQAIADATVAFLDAVAGLGAMVAFPVQLARTVRGFLTAMIGTLQSLRAEIVRLIARATDANAVIALAQQLGNAAMLANAQCVLARVNADVAQLNRHLAGLGVAMALFSIVLCLVTGGHLPLLPTLDPNALVAEAFDPIILALTIARDAIPDVAGLPLECP